MRTRFATSARIVLGIVMTLFGLNGFLHFMPMWEMAEPANNFMGAILATGYLMILVKIVETSVGLLLLTNRYVPLALVLLSPIGVNVVSFQLFLDPSGIGPAALVAVLDIYLLFAYRSYFSPLFTMHAQIDLGGDASTSTSLGTPATA